MRGVMGLSTVYFVMSDQLQVMSVELVVFMDRMQTDPPQVFWLRRRAIKKSRLTLSIAFELYAGAVEIIGGNGI